MRKIALWAAVAVYLAAIFYLSAQPDPLPALTSRVSDKLLHLVEYGGLALLLGRALLAVGMTTRRALVTTVLVASLYGASDELHQAFVPSRSCDVRDWAADTAGAILGAALAVSFLRQRGTRASIPG